MKYLILDFITTLYSCFAAVKASTGRFIADLHAYMSYEVLIFFISLPHFTPISRPRKQVRVVLLRRYMYICNMKYLILDFITTLYSCFATVKASTGRFIADLHAYMSYEVLNFLIYYHTLLLFRGRESKYGSFHCGFTCIYM